LIALKATKKLKHYSIYLAPGSRRQDWPFLEVPIQGRFLRQIFPRRILQVRFSPDGHLLATANRDGQAMLLDVQDSHKLPLVASFPNPASVLGVRFAGKSRSIYKGEQQLPARAGQPDPGVGRPFDRWLFWDTIPVL
jgi:WD40 repeat protein